MNKTAKIVGNGIAYKFVLLDAMHGIWLYHEKVKAWREKVADIDSAIKLFSELEIQEIYELCAFMLPNAEVAGEKCNEAGFCDSFARKPHLLYEALLFAVAANYPDYFPFLQGEASDMTENL